MLAIFTYLKAISKSLAPVLISGETGSGKELIAKAFHNCQGSNKPFVVCNVAGLDDQLFSDTLFGHKKGAYTGALSDRAGLVAKAEGGILFLDEIGDLSLASQVKLLRLLQEHEYTPLGSDVSVSCSIRIIAATHKKLELAMKNEEFRSDLFYRLRTHTIELPSLKERIEDVGLLLEHFVSSVAKSMGKAVPTIPSSLTSLLTHYDFPGNIRELRAMVEDAVARSSDEVLPLSSFVEKVGLTQEEVEDLNSSVGSFEGLLNDCACLPQLNQMKELLIKEAMNRSQQRQSQAAKVLGISKQALGQWFKRHDSLEQ